MSDEAYRRLEVLFVTGALRPGSLISESQLTERMKMGRAPVWDAIKRFEAHLLLQPVHRKGIFVSELTHKDQLYLAEVRRPLEILIFRTAAERADDTERALLLKQKDMFLDAHARLDQTMMLQADYDYKRAAIAATRNPFIAQSIGSIHILARRFWNMNMGYETRPMDMNATVRHHVAIIDATVKGDIAKVTLEVESFIEFLKQVTLRLIRESIQL